jgi:uncharacterized UPF0146 family protein
MRYYSRKQERQSRLIDCKLGFIPSTAKDLSDRSFTVKVIDETG